MNNHDYIPYFYISILYNLCCFVGNILRYRFCIRGRFVSFGFGIFFCVRLCFRLGVLLCVRLFCGFLHILRVIGNILRFGFRLAILGCRLLSCGNSRFRGRCSCLRRFLLSDEHFESTKASTHTTITATATTTHTIAALLFFCFCFFAFFCFFGFPE